MNRTHEVASAAAAGPPLPPFLSKTYDMVDDPSTDALVSWTDGNNSFAVWNVTDFSSDLLPKYFKHNNFSSFVRQLNTYGFRKIDPDRYEFAHEAFLRGQKNLLKTIKRRNLVHVQPHQGPPSQYQSKLIGACVGVRNFGLEKEVESLTGDKNILMQELVSLGQQQQGTGHQLQIVGQRIKAMEQRQQQMLSFLSKALQRPGFLAQLVQLQNESKMCISRGNKKRRLGEQEDQSSREYAPVSRNRQIIKYQPVLNDAAKSMLRQLPKISPSPMLGSYPHLESSVNNVNTLLIDDVELSHTLSQNASLSPISGVSGTEMPELSGHVLLPAEAAVPVNCEFTSIKDIQSCPSAVEATQCLGLSAMNYEDTCSPPVAEVQDIVPQTAVDIPGMDVMDCDPVTGGYSCLLSAAGDNVRTTEESGNFSRHSESNDIADKICKLPSINEAFWEQFLISSPVSANMDEVSTQKIDGNFFRELDVQSA